MANRSSLNFNEVINLIEKFPQAQQESLLEIMRHRIIESRRDVLAINIKKAKREFAAGKVRCGTVKDLMKEV